MNFNKNLWDTTEAKEFGEFENLELGGHQIIILDAREYVSETSGNTSLKISVDIAQNEPQADFFKKQYDNNTNMNKKWPSGAVKYLSLRDEQLSYLKGFISCLEKSNSNFKFNTNGNWEQLKNLKCAGVFGLEEYTKQDGTTGTTTKLVQFRSLDKLNDIKIPKVKLLDGTFVEYEDYNKSDVVKDAQNIFGKDMVEIADDLLPF